MVSNCVSFIRELVDNFVRDISWSLITKPRLWLFALSQGREGLAFVGALRAMRRAYSNQTFQYAVLVFGK